MRIRASARKHGIHDEDIRQALAYARAVSRLEPDEGLARTLLIGPDRAGNLLELVILHRDSADDVLIHAMRLRPRYHALLRRHGR